jgi:hypothetical protein
MVADNREVVYFPGVTQPQDAQNSSWLLVDNLNADQG